MAGFYLETAESDSAMDKQKAGLKSSAQSVSCYLKDALYTPTQAGSYHSYTVIL